MKLTDLDTCAIEIKQPSQGHISFYCMKSLTLVHLAELLKGLRLLKSGIQCAWCYGLHSITACWWNEWMET